MPTGKTPAIPEIVTGSNLDDIRQQLDRIESLISDEVERPYGVPDTYWYDTLLPTNDPTMGLVLRIEFKPTGIHLQMHAGGGQFIFWAHDLRWKITPALPL